MSMGLRLAVLQAAGAPLQIEGLNPDRLVSDSSALATSPSLPPTPLPLTIDIGLQC